MIKYKRIMNPILSCVKRRLIMMSCLGNKVSYLVHCGRRIVHMFASDCNPLFAFFFIVFFSLSLFSYFPLFVLNRFLFRKNRTATKTLSVWRYPDFLIIILKRFVYLEKEGYFINLLGLEGK